MADNIVNESEGSNIPQDPTPITADVELVDVLLISNEGGGFADRVKVKKGLLLTAVLLQKLELDNIDELDDSIVKVNNDAVPVDYRIEGGERITVTPKKVEGA